MTEQTQIRLMTAEEFATLPDDGKVYDLVDGVLVEVSRPKPIHGKLQRRLGARLGDFVDERELGEVVTDAGFILSRNPDKVRSPDVAYVSKERAPAPNLDEYFTVAPDIAVEVVSTNDTTDEVLGKIEEYFAVGTRLVWIVYPERRKVYAYSSPNTVTIVPAEGTLSGGDVLPEFSLSLADLFKGLDA